MAKIRDAVVTQLTAEATTISCVLPTHETNDLLLVIVSKDAAISGSWAVTVASGWAIGGSASQTANAWVWAWKIATSSSETNPTLGQSDSDSMLAVAMSIRGVDTGTPFHVNPGNGTGSTGASGAPTVAGAATSVTNVLMIYSICSDLGVGPTPDPGLIRVCSDDSGSASLGVGWTFQPATGTSGTYAFTCANPSGTSLPRYTACFGIKDDGTSGQIPAYHDPGQTLATMIDPITGTTYPLNTGWQATTIDITTIGSKSAAYDAIGNVADAGVNPFHAVAQITPVASSNLGGTQFNFSASKNVSAGLLLWTFRFATPRDYIDTGFVSTGGIQLVLADASNNYRSWMVGAQSAKTTLPAGHNLVAIQPGQSSSTRYADGGTLGLSAVTKFLFLQTNPLGAGALNMSQLVQVTGVRLAGGSSSVPATFADLVSVLNGFVLAFAPQLGPAAIMCYVPIQIGGAKAVALDASNFAIQFPRRAAQTTGYLDFHVDENVVGFIFDGQSGDVIKLRSGLIASDSKFKFEFLSSVSASATWDFYGLTIIGATPTLRNIGTSASAGFRSMSFIDCDQIVQNGATLTACTVDDTLHATAALLSDDPGKIASCTFLSGGTKHAIEITTAGTYAFVGNVFSGYAASNGSTGNEAIFNNSGGAVTLNVSGASAPSVRNGSGASTTVNANVTVTLTGLKNPSEVRVFAAGTTTELADTGAESVTDGDHAFSVGSGVAVDIAILSLGYQNLRILNYSTTSNATVPVSQVLDRQYENP
jgi:hypothetical protein